MLSFNGYGNIEIYSIDNNLIFRCNQSRLAFYQKKNLVECIGDNKYKLNFFHNCSNSKTELSAQRDNKCVRCGCEDFLTLTRHHIIPTRFRKHFPLEIKSYNSKYIVFLCTDCHYEYNECETIFNEELAEKFNVKSYKECCYDIVTEKKILVGIANTLIYYKDKLPIHRINFLEERFKKITGLEPVEENLFKSKKRRYEPMSPENDFGRLIFDKITNIYEFQQMWLEHFVNNMNPKYLPEDLKVLLIN